MNAQEEQVEPTNSLLTPPPVLYLDVPWFRSKKGREEDPEKGATVQERSESEIPKEKNSRGDQEPQRVVVPKEVSMQ
ncbi:jg7638 [Pararge aegeria aegeria]|uniref:Jg7638 protein n=1 Tax=Pararge aegeria aegeria TaxID=348720 RepID=A0A8S4RHI1_9NEOP|nr:jg7638 [Pararge aegeria aegeria]